jgi:hypothetical protein
VVTYLATADDDLDGPTPVDCAPASGSMFPLGQTTVSCTATDSTGNWASAQFTIDVTYTWLGFTQPVHPDGSSVFKLGRTVPVRFQLGGDSASITDAVATLGVAKLSNIVAGSFVEDAGNASSDTGNTFRYDATAKQYIFNLSTSGAAWTRGTYALRVDLDDGVGSRTVEISLW